jgi:olefin beta-lactone synthetase
MREDANIARHLAAMAAAHPRSCALKVPRGRTRNGDIDYLALDFAELDAEVGAWCERLAGAGLQRGDRTLVMVRQGLPLIASVFALFRFGAVPVVIDPGMGLKSFLACVARSRPRALVGIPIAQVISRMFRGSFASVRVRVGASNSLTGRLNRRDGVERTAVSAPVSLPTDIAAILFTSGSTGTPKGVCYEHGMFDAQVRLIRETYAIQPGEIDLPLLPIFALFNPALGMTTIVPEIDPRRPAAFDAAKIVQAIQQENVTNSFGSPTLWSKIGDHCRARNLTLPTLRRVLCAGAAVPAKLWQDSRHFLSNGKLHSPYGATEALPIATISSDEIVADSTRGACVGRTVPEIEIKIVEITDAPISSLAAVRELPPGQIGEIIVRGGVVTKTYDSLPDATLMAKIPGPTNQSRLIASSSAAIGPAQGIAIAACPLPRSPSGPAPSADEVSTESAVWHRMGDCGYLDEKGRLWFCGRKAERVQTANGTLHTEPCEQVFRRNSRAARCALVGIGEPGRQRPALVVETRVRDSDEARVLANELRALALEHEHTSDINHFYFRERFPVDVRHNAKIHRLTLAEWAKTATAYNR